MQIRCTLGDIRTNAAIWELMGRKPADAVCTRLKSTDLASAFRLDAYYDRHYPAPNGFAFLMRQELRMFYISDCVYEFDFRIVIPVLNGFFRLARERKDTRSRQLFPANLLHFYREGAEMPDILSRGELYDTAVWFLTSGGANDPDSTECIIDVPEKPAPAVWCKLRDLEQVLDRTVGEIRRHRECFELEPMRWFHGAYPQRYLSDNTFRSAVYVFDFTVRVPALGLMIREGDEFDLLRTINGSYLRWIDSCGLAYDDDGWQRGSFYETIPEYVKWEFEHNRLHYRFGIEADDLDCVIELPYRRSRTERYPVDPADREDADE